MTSPFASEERTMSIASLMAPQPGVSAATPHPFLNRVQGALHAVEDFVLGPSSGHAGTAAVLPLAAPATVSAPDPTAPAHAVTVTPADAAHAAAAIPSPPNQTTPTPTNGTVMTAFPSSSVASLAGYGTPVSALYGAAPGTTYSASYGTGQLPQVNATNQSGLSNSPDGIEQSVTNANHWGSRGSYDGGEYPGVGYGGYDYGVGGYAPGVLGYSNPLGLSPAGGYLGYAPYGASMTGAYYLTQPQTGIMGWFHRIFG
jgi:hypothetical protein